MSFTTYHEHRILKEIVAELVAAGAVVREGGRSDQRPFTLGDLNDIDLTVEQASLWRALAEEA